MQVLKLPKHASKNIPFLKKKKKKLLITSNKTDQLKFIIIPNHAHIKQYIKSTNRKGFRTFQWCSDALQSESTCGCWRL